MKYTTDVEINLPRDNVVELFDNTENLYKWMPGLKNFEHVSGTAGDVGAKSTLLFDMNGRKVEMIETITLASLPNQFNATYEAKGVFNVVNNKFVDNGNSTKWILESEFQFSGFMKIFALFMKSAFPKQTLTNMTNFKEFAEKQ